MAKSGLNVYKRSYSQPMPLHFPQQLIDDASELATILGSNQAYTEWARSLPGYVILNHGAYHEAIKLEIARLVGAERVLS